ncbi:Protein of unknown function [Thalassovita litoralis]|jgi:hypothetical protein|uniref:Gene transfer agent protein n=1 Tax=Thalassovita litoralis TaxID=1010611 RepID=A0A521FLW1_9RHOB|nr:DUF3168 domain-containing protein [Thalassovita litoralis]SMO97129.1 Protein of unknown function [Thalassovita litoralis]
MSYAVASALQTAVYHHLLADAAVAALVGTDIYDAIPTGTLPTTYVTLGPELARDKSDMTGAGAQHEFTVSVHTSAAGFGVAKDAAAAICDALVDADLVLSRGHLVALNFYKAQTLRESTGERRIDLKFRARVDDN